MKKEVNLYNIIKSKCMPEDVLHQVWYCKTLQHKKGLYYNETQKCYIEATYNGNTNEIYVDVYEKVDKGIGHFQEDGSVEFEEVE